MKEHIKEWLKKNGKEIKIAAASACVTAVLFIKFGDRQLPLKPHINLNLEVGGRFMKPNETMWGHLDLPISNVTLNDFGKAGKEIQKSIPGILKNIPVNAVAINYRIPR